MILIVDFGSQYTHLITSTLEYEIGVMCDLLPYTKVDKQKITSYENLNGIILSGGPRSLTDFDLTQLNWLDDIEVPVLGICFGLQLLTQFFGGKVVTHSQGEFGKATLALEKLDSHLLNNVVLPSTVWMSHNDIAETLPEGFDSYASTSVTANAIIENQERRMYAVQFHPEVKHTRNGKKILRNFVKRICKCKVEKKKNVYNQVAKMISDIQETVGDKHVLLALSGGVDSSVLCKLLHMAIPNQLWCVYVDHGMMRKGETEEIRERFKFLNNLIVCEESHRYLTKLKGVSDPEEKRKIIGNTFIEVFYDALKNMKEQPEYLAQGTIYPDIIESCGVNNTAKVIKSHHNVGGLPDKLHLKLLEPFRFLFKNQIKKIGEFLGVTEDVIQRHPFPGPGLGIRILGEVKEEYIKILQEADSIFIKKLKDADMYNSISQAYVGFLPVKTVGVVGDNRRYGYTVVLRAVQTEDYMTANIYEFPEHFLSEVSTEIVNKCSEISRVFYDVTTKPPSTIELE